MEVLRRLARDHWVRLHGTPRVTVLVGGTRARALWQEWAAVAGVTAVPGEGSAAISDAVARAMATPSDAIAVVVGAADLVRWRSSAAPRSDRVRMLVDEGTLVVDEGPARTPIDARSAAEAALFEALETTPSTAGRFELNGKLSVHFGPAAAEVDLLARRERIAIEIDGYHHFVDADGYRRDRDKDLLLQTQGLLVVRVLAEDVARDPRAAIAMVCRALAHRLDEARR